MVNINSSGLGHIGGAGSPVPQDGVPSDRARGSTATRKRRDVQGRRRRPSDLYDVPAAVQRLLELLAHDLEFGIPENVPLRGYYLNILV